VAVIGEDMPRMTTGTVTLRRVALLDDEDRAVDRIVLGQPFVIALEFAVDEEVTDGVIEVGLTTGDGVRVVTTQTYDAEGELVRFAPGTHEVRARFDMTLLPGEFTVDVGLHRINGLTLDFVERTLTFTALNVAADGAGRWPWNAVRGAVRGAATWTVGARSSNPR
jgi:hypothetical protein